MRKFNLEEALAGKPVLLRNGNKAIVYYNVPENFKLFDGYPIRFPLKGLTFTNNGAVQCSAECWTRNGDFDDSGTAHLLDIIGMYEDSIEDIIKKAFKEHLPLKTRNNTKVFISTIVEDTNALTEKYSVFGYSTTTDCYRWTLDGKFLFNTNDLDIVGLWEE